MPNIQVQDPNRDGLIAVTDPINNAVYVPRGAQQPDYSLLDIYEFRTGTLRTIPIADPDNVFYGRQYNTGVWSSYLKAIIFYGGYGSFGRAENVTAYDPARNTYTSLKSPGTVLPASRADHCAAISDDGTFMIIYGGRPYTGTLHILDLKTMGWKEGALGEARMYHNCAIAGNLFITWGGQNEQNVVGVRAPTLPVRIYNITSDRWVDEYVPPESYRSSTPPNGNGSKDESKSGNNGVVIGASVAAVVVVLAGIIAVVIYRRRRYRHHSHGNGSRLISPSYEAGGDGRETKALTTAVDASDDGQPQHFHQQHTMAGDVYHHPHNHHSFTAPPLSSAVSRPTTIGAPQLLHEHELQVLNGADTPTTIASSTAVQSPVQYFPSPSTLGSSSPTVTISSPTPSLSGTTAVASSTQQLVMPPIAQPSWQQQQQQQQQTQQQPVAGHQFERNAMVDLRASTASTTSKSPHAVVTRPNYGFYDTTTTQNNPHAILE
ncbi:hypothetical protein BGW42_006968 [Actinomortierella wolfii]|nr:hypothetical protein BGW42_006968 [Actinomortierella wolfii]